MSRTYDISAADLPRKFREIEARRPDAVMRGVVSAALAGAEVVAQSAPKDTGDLRRSVRAQLVGKGAVIVVDAPHAGIVEMGSRPHVPPLGPLLDWTRRHFPGSAAEQERIARAIQQKIAVEGTKPTYFMRKNLPKLRRLLKAEIEHELAAEEKK